MDKNIQVSNLDQIIQNQLLGDCGFSRQSKF